MLLYAKTDEIVLPNNSYKMGGNAISVKTLDLDFVRSHTVPNFFTDHYDHPIYECGVHLVDMVYLQRPL